MSGPTGRGLSSRKNFVTSFLLSLILIGSVISSASLLGLTISTQQAWAALPGAPGLSSPATGSTTTNPTPTFDWNTVSATPAVTSYHLLVDNNADFLSPEININVAAPTTQHTPSSNLAPATYNWKVSAINSDGEGAFSTTRTVNIVDLPAPTLSSPANGAILEDLTPTFDFSRIDPEPSGLLYQIQADNSGNTFPSPEVDNTQSSSESSEFTPSSNLAEGTYSWRVGSKSNAADPPSWSTVRTVTLDNGIGPAAPSLISPPNGGFTNDQTPLFDWSDASDVSGINRYTLQYSQSPTFSSGVTTQNIDGTPPVSQFTPSTNLAVGQWFWRVSARDGAGNTGPVSSTNSFTIDITAPATAPSLVFPANAATINDNTPTFDWSDVSDTGSVTYELLVDTDNIFVNPFTISESSLSSSTFTAGSAISDGTYFWKVRAKDAAGNNGPFSSIFSFTLDATVPTAPSITSPTAGTQNTAISSISGTSGETGLTIQVFNGATSLGTTTSGSGGAWSLTLGTALGEGSYSFTATAKDAATNTSPASDPAVNVEVDTTVPAAPAITDPTASPPPRNTAISEISGTSEAEGLEIEVIDATLGSLGTTTSTTGGAWTLSLGTELGEGTYSLTANATDAAGNPGPASDAVNVEVDTTVPAAPAITDPTASPPPRNTAISEISGTSEAEGLEIEVIDATLGSLGTTTSTTGGAWTLSLGTELGEGTYSLTANATDAAGNPGPASDAVNVEVDTTVPAAPAITDPTASPPPRNTAISEISGTSEAEGLEIEVIDATLGSLGTTTSTTGGAWTLSLGTELGEGTYSLTANATDAAGNPGPASDAVNVEVDTTAPAAPAITDPTASPPPRNTAISEISGTSEAEGLEIEVIDATLGSLGTTTSTTGGAWTLTLGTELGEGTYSLTANATDAAGNPGPASDAVNVEVDTTAPAAPAITDPTASPPPRNTAISEISGTSEAEGLEIEVIDATLGSLGTTTSTTGGAWTLSLGTELGEGTYSLTANATDAAGNPGPASDAVNVEVDTTVPAAPAITDPTASPPPRNTAISEISGTSEAEGLEIEVIDATLGSLGTTTSTTGGAWTLSLGTELGEGTYSLTANATDAAGNPGPASDAVNVEVDTTVPAAPAITDPTASPPPRNTAISEISGTSEAEGLEIEVIDATLGSLGTTTSTTGGAWTLSLGTELGEGTYSLTANATDAAGNPGPASDAVDVTVDTTVPAAPAITDPTASPPPRNTAISEISGTSEAEGLEIEVIDATLGSLGTTTSTTGGAWTLSLGTELGEGTYSLTANATDAAGNPGPASDAVDVTVDTTVPAAPVITDPTDGATLNTAITEISGTSEAEGLEIEVFDGAASLGTTTSGSGGAWSLTGLSLGTGTYSFTATANDGVNTSPASAAVNVVVQTTPTTTDTSMSLKLSANKATPGATFTASGKLIDTIADLPIAGQSITFTIDGTSAGSPVTTDNKGEFSIQLTAPITAGDHTIQAHFAGDTQYNPSDSPVRTLKVEGAAPADTSLSLKLSKDKVNAGSSFSASGTLMNEVTKKPIAGMTISVTGGLTTQTGTTDSKGKYDIQLTAPNTNGDHNIQAHFAATAQYESSDSPISKITVQGGTNALTTTAITGIDTSLSLKVEGKDEMTAGEEYSVSGKLIDSASKKPISGKEISVTTDGNSPKGTDTTNSKGEFEVDLKAPESAGKYDIKAEFDGDSQYKSSDSSVKITVEETEVSSQKTTVTTNQPNTDEQQTDEQQTDEQQTDEQQTDEQQTDEQQTDEQQTDEQQTDEQQTDEQQTDEQQTDEQQADEQQAEEEPEEEPEG